MATVIQSLPLRSIGPASEPTLYGVTDCPGFCLSRAGHHHLRRRQLAGHSQGISDSIVIWIIDDRQSLRILALSKNRQTSTDSGTRSTPHRRDDIRRNNGINGADVSH